MTNHATGCIEQIRRLGFKPGTQLNLYCPQCSGSIKVFSDNLDRAEIQKFLSDHGGHGSCFFGFNDGRRWEIQKNGGIEFNDHQRTDLGIEAKTPEEPPSEDDPFEDETWIKLYRKFIKNPIFKDSPSVHLWVYLLLKANHKSNRFLFNKKEITVKRGQLITGLKKISKDTGISEWRIRDRLKAFNDLGMTSSKTTNKFRIITLCNYKEHQDSIFEKPQAKPQAPEGRISDPKPQSSHNQPSTNKNDKNYKNNNGRSKKDSDPRVSEFKNWWRETLLQEKGVPYHFDHGKDGAITQKLLSTFDLPDLKQYALDFLDGDDQGERLGFTIGVFSQAVNRIAQKKAADPIEQIKRRERLKKERETQTL